MLVLTRKQNEKIRIGNEIIVTVLRTKGKGVRLGIEAPAYIPVLRGELAFEMPTEKPKPEAASADRALQPASRGTANSRAAKPGGLRQTPASHWPASPISQTGRRNPGARRKTDTSCQEGALRRPAKGHSLGSVT